MSAYDWIALATLGLDHWAQPRQPRTTYEIERQEAWDQIEALQRAKRRARRKALMKLMRRSIRVPFRRRPSGRSRYGPPQKPASHV
jgi:hypothetical protein